jgi:hypothetical protein
MRQKAWLLMLALAIAGASCRRELPARAGLGIADPGVEEAIELLMGDDVRAAQRLGAADPELAQAGTGVSGDSLGGFADIPEGRCALLLGRGTRGVQDVDVFVFDDDGTVLASDEAPTQHANLVVCPAKASRVFASTRLAAGFGMFGITLMTIAPEQVAGLGERFGLASSGPSELSELSSSWPGLDERLSEHRRRLGGSWDTLRKVALPLDPRAYVNVSAVVDGDTCLDVYATPSDDVAHLELEVLDASGRWIGSGEARGTDRNLMICSSEPREIAIRCRPHAGRGLSALVLSSAGRSEVAGSSARFDLRPDADLAALRQQSEQRLAGRGYGRPLLAREGVLQTDRRTSVSLTLASGCSRVDVLTAAPLRSLRTWLWDARGQLIADDLGGIDATLFACGPSTKARLDLDTSSRAGAFSVEVRHSGWSPSGAAGSPLALGRLLRLLDARGRLASLAQLPEIHSARLSESELGRFSLVVPAGRCLELSAALDRGASGLEVRLLDVTLAGDEPDQEEAVVGYGSNVATARTCAVKPASERNLVAELRANVGGGTALWVSQTFDPDPNSKTRVRR